MDDQELAAASTDDDLEAFVRAIGLVRGWKHATSERLADDRVRVTNPAAGLWLECRYRRGSDRGFMSVGQIGDKAFFEPEFFWTDPEFVTFRARQFVQGVRQRQRRAVLRRMTWRHWLWSFRTYRAQSSPRRREPRGVRWRSAS